MDTAGMLAEVDAELEKLQAFRASIVAFSGNGAPPPATRVPRAAANGTRKAPKPAKRSASATRGENGDEKRAKGAALWAKGRTISQISTELGVSYQSVWGWKKSWPEQSAAPAGEEPQRFRCQECKQFGVDPKRCEHCMEKR